MPFMKLRGITFKSSSQNATRASGRQSRGGSTTVSSISSSSSTDTAQRLRRMKLHIPRTAIDEKSEVSRISHRRQRIEDSPSIVSFHHLFFDQDAESDTGPTTTWLLVELAQKMGIRALVPLFFLTAFMLRVSQPVAPSENIAPYYLRVPAHRMLPNETTWLDEAEQSQMKQSFTQINASMYSLRYLEKQRNGTNPVRFENEDSFRDGMNNPFSDTGKRKSKSWFGRGRSKRVTPATTSTSGLRNITLQSGSGSNGTLLQRAQGLDQSRSSSSEIYETKESMQLVADGSDGFMPTTEDNQLEDNPGNFGSVGETSHDLKSFAGRKGQNPAGLDSHSVQGGQPFDQSKDGSDGGLLPLLSTETTELSKSALESEFRKTGAVQNLGRPPGGAIGGNRPQPKTLADTSGLQSNSQVNAGGPGKPKMSRGVGDTHRSDAGLRGGTSILKEEGDKSAAGGPGALTEDGEVEADDKAGPLQQLVHTQNTGGSLPMQASHMKHVGNNLHSSSSKTIDSSSASSEMQPFGVTRTGSFSQIGQSQSLSAGRTVKADLNPRTGSAPNDPQQDDGEDASIATSSSTKQYGFDESGSKIGNSKSAKQNGKGQTVAGDIKQRKPAEMAM